MRSGHGKACVARIALSFAVTFGLALRVQAAPVRVACFDPGDRELRARIEGQTRDLPLRLIWIAPYVGRLPSARELEQAGKEQAATFVVSLAASASGGFTVQVYDVVRQQLRTRTVPAPGNAGRLGASTAAETAALIVRGELRAGLTGGAGPEPPGETPETESGPSTTATLDSASGDGGGSPSGLGSASHAQRPAPEPREPAKPAVPTPPLPEQDEPKMDYGLPETTSEPPGRGAGRSPARPERVFSLALGPRLSAPGSGIIQAGAWIAARFELRGFELGLAASSMLPADLQNGAVRIALRRHAVGADLLALALTGSALELWFGVSGGVVLHARHAYALDEVREPTPNSTTLGAAFGALAELRFRFTHNLGLSVRAGLDVLPAPPRFTFERADGMGARQDLAALRPIEPFLILALFVRSWH